MRPHARLTTSLSAALLVALCFATAHAQLVPIAPELRVESGETEVLTVELHPEMLYRELALSLLARLDHELPHLSDKV